VEIQCRGVVTGVESYWFYRIHKLTFTRPVGQTMAGSLTLVTVWGSTIRERSAGRGALTLVTV
jgi:hypothetical protein